MELMVALAIVMVLIGVGSHMGSVYSNEQALHKPMDKMKEYAKRAAHLAIAEQRSWEVIVYPNRLVMQPKEATTEDGQAFLNAADKRQERNTDGESVTFEPDIRLAIRRFGEDKWQTPRPDHWVFQHSGICEPIHFRVERELRALEVGFDPLTAGAIGEAEVD
jgi:hypothetical protein